MDYFVYFLENDRGRHYVGITIDTARRLNEHNEGNTKSTRPFRPWKIIYTESFSSRSEACKREWHLKHSIGRKEKIEIINSYGKAGFLIVK
ncbi:MAG: GIY-YIG nuclease family protein [Patescibacteria group bacterium]|jgi:putative endonuclease